MNESRSDVQIVGDVEAWTQRPRPSLARDSTVASDRVESGVGVTVVKDSGAEIAHGNGRRGGAVELGMPREGGVAGFVRRHDDGARRTTDDTVIVSVAVIEGMVVIG